MTAFAAIVQKGQDRPEASEVAGTIGAIAAAPASVLVLGRCAMVVAPLHRDDPETAVSLPSGVTVAGSILLEGHRHFAASLREPASATAAALAGAAYDKWSGRCTDHLPGGEYAFALWDAREQMLLCARDGIGLRLLYVADSPEAIVVTNVLSAALRHPSIAADVDEAAAIAFLAHGGAADEIRTCYRHVSVLPAGHTLVWNADRGLAAAMRRHWTFPLPDGTRRVRDSDILAEYRSTLAEAVRDRVSGAGTSIFLSGGVDSTTMAAAAIAVTAPPRRLHAITTRYPRYVDDVELPYAREAATALDLPLTVVDADRHEPWSAHRMDPPLAEPIDEPMLADWREAVAHAAAHGTVALYGEDGDVLLRPPAWQGLRNEASLATIGLAAVRYAIAEGRRPYIGLRLRERMGIVPATPAETPRWLTASARARLEGYTAGRVLGHAAEPLPPHPTRPETQDRLTSPTVSRTFAATIAPEVTRQRVELRFPLYDRRLIGLVVSVPAIPWCQHKTLPRRAYGDRLPARVLNRPKTPLHGFNEALVAAWRRGLTGQPAPGTVIEEWIDAGEWTRALESGNPNAAMAAWRVIALEAFVTGRTGLAARSRAVRGSACTP